MSTPDQHVIDQLVAQMDAPNDENAQTNGQGHAVVRSDAEILDLCRRARNAAKFADLYDAGDAHRHHGGDDSRADQALASMFAFYTQDPAQLERLISGSALGQRPKWRNRPDYRRRTIDKALSGGRETYTQPLTTSPPSPLPISRNGDGGDSGDLPLVWFSQLGKPKVREFLIGDTVPRNHPTVIHGWSGTAKSILALLMAMAISGNRARWLGLDVHTNGKVLYLDFELDADEQLRRVHALASGMGVAVPPNLAYLSALGMGTPDAFGHAYEICREHDVVMVVIDSLGPAMLGDMEAARDVIKFHNEYIAPFRAIGTTPLIIDHQGKLQAGENYQQKTAFGSAYKEHLSRSVLQVEAGDRDRDRGILDVRVRHKKSNFGARLDPFDVRLEFGSEKITATCIELDDAALAAETTLNSKDRVLKALQAGPAFPDDLAQMTGLAHGTVVNCLTQLKRVGKVETTGEVRGKAQEVCATPSPSLIKGDGDGGDDGATPEQQQRIRKLVGAGMSEKWAREEVLGSEPKVVSYESGKPYEEYVGRGKRGTNLKKSKWHNPFVEGDDKDGTREEVIAKFERYLDGPVENYEGKVFDGRRLKADLHELRGKTLCCHCAPEICHADHLLKLANANVSGDSTKHPKGCLCMECLP